MRYGIAINLVVMLDNMNTISNPNAKLSYVLFKLLCVFPVTM